MPANPVPLRISIATYGTRGDVQPFVALAKALQARGHRVSLAAPHGQTGFIEGHGVTCVPLAGDPGTFVRELNDKAGNNMFKVVQTMLDFVTPLAESVSATLRPVFADSDVIISSFLATTGSHALAMEYGARHVSAQFFPVFTPTGDFPAPSFPVWPLGRAYNRLTHALFKAVFWGLGHSSYGRMAKGRPAFPQKVVWPFDASVQPPVLRLYAHSQTLLPTPADWPAEAHVTGNWHLNEGQGWQPPAELADFLAAGEPPVCISLGSIEASDVQGFYDTLTGTLLARGQRVAVFAGLNEVRFPADERLLVLPPTPHDWLFPRMQAIIHHGGAGVTGEALRSGVPQIVMPFSADQPFWAAQVARLGVAARPIPPKQLSRERLLDALAQTSQPGMRARAAHVAGQVRQERGVDTAVNLIEAYAQSAG